MKILLLADGASAHVQKWAIALANSGVHIGVFTFNYSEKYWWANIPNLEMLFQPDRKYVTSKLSTKLKYITYLKKLKKVIKDFNPDIVHSHYASSYGLLGRLSGFKPYVITAWGTDVMKFPFKNSINKKILIANFKSANVVCASSYVTEEYIHKIVDLPIHVIPFGAECDKFSPGLEIDKDEITIGSIKSLEAIYRMDLLIESFNKVQVLFPHKKLKLLIVGGGSLEASLKAKCDELGISKDVTFTGKIGRLEVIEQYRKMDVFCNLSDYESFGVSIVEAMACGVAVVATDSEGAKEIIVNENLGTLVRVGDVEDVTRGIAKYVKDDTLRKSTALNARQHVFTKYNWKGNVQEMIDVYTNLLK